jgi:SAM-dependent methyltransferase
VYRFELYKLRGYVGCAALKVAFKPATIAAPHHLAFNPRRSAFTSELPMRLRLAPESLLELLGLLTGQVPHPIAHVLGGSLLARAISVATQIGVFEALRDGPRSVAAIAERCHSHPDATHKLLGALARSGYLVQRGEQFGLARLSRTWLLRDAPHSLYDLMLYEALEYQWLTRLDDFVRGGQPLDFHATMTDDEWRLYQRGMRALAGMAASEIAWRTPVPRGARSMLDIGGAHGYYSVALCRRHRHLRASVLDLPQAIAHAAPLLAAEGLGDRVTHRPADARTADLGDACHDLILIAQLVHHFDAETNRDLVRRAAQALRPGGVLVILEALRQDAGGIGGQMAGLLDLYFSFTSRSGTWSREEMVDWQRAAGLQPQRPIGLLRLPGYALLAARRPT